MILELRRLFGHLSRRRRWQLGAIFLLMLLGVLPEMVVIGAVVPFLALLTNVSLLDQYPFVSKAFSMLGWGGETDTLLLASILLAVAAIAAAALRAAISWANLTFTQGVGADIRGEVYSRILYQPYSFHVSNNTSIIIAGLNKTGSVTQTIQSLTRCCVALIFSLAILAVLIRIDPATAGVAIFGISFLYIAVTLLTARRLRVNGGIIARNERRRVQAILEGLGGIRDVILDGSQHVYLKRFKKFDYAQNRARAAIILISESPRYLIEALGIVFIVFFAFWLGHRSGGISGAIPMLGALALGAQKVLPLVQQFYSNWTIIRGGRSSVMDVLTLLEQPMPSEFRQAPSPGALRLSDRIVLHNVSFRYRSDAPDVIDNLSLEIPRGSRIGLVGETGSGKSTLTDLVMGLLEPTGGSITIDGQVLCSHNRRAWQARVAHVPQTIYLADASIAENIAFGMELEQIDLERVRDAARNAQLADFIEGLPEKYLTSVGENGIRLSGGQRQRIGLARALHKQADFLVLDEATNSLDDVTERSVLNAIKSLSSEITVLIVAHRISTLRDCSHVIELRNGKIARSGSYGECQEWRALPDRQERGEAVRRTADFPTVS
jgi:ATP-binding cassette, subfamily B, bacterial PglK